MSTFSTRALILGHQRTGTLIDQHIFHLFKKYIDGVQPKMSPKNNLPVCIKNHSFILVIGPILYKELECIYKSNCSDRTCVYSKVSVLYDKIYAFFFAYINAPPSANFKNSMKNRVTVSVRIFAYIKTWRKLSCFLRSVSLFGYKNVM